MCAFAAAAAALVLACSGDYNPFEDASNARAVVVRSTVEDGDTVGIFTAETIDIAVTVRPLVEKVTFSCAKNRFGAGRDSVLAQACLLASETGRFSFRLSLWDTGWTTATITTRRTNGEEAVLSYRLRGISPLRQDTVKGELGQPITLSTPPVADRDVLYQWDFGMGTVISSQACAVQGAIRVADMAGRGVLTVADLANAALRSPPRPFVFRLDDRSAPTIMVSADSMRGDTVIAATADYALSLVVADPGSGAVARVLVNGSRCDVEAPPHYQRTFYGLDTQPAATGASVYAEDGFGNSAARTFWILHDSTAGRAGGIRLVRDVPAGDNPVSLRRDVEVAGHVEGYTGTAPLSIRARAGDSTSAAVSVSALDGYRWVRTVHLGGVRNTVVITACTPSGDSVAGLTFDFFYDANAQDQEPPRIIEVTVNGRLWQGGALDTAVAQVCALAFDQGRGIASVAFNGQAMPAGSSPWQWCRSIALDHGQSPSGGNRLDIVATDSGGLSSDTTLWLLHNRPPVVVRAPYTPAVLPAGGLYLDSITVQDPDAGDAVQIRADTLPPGMELLGGRILRWQTRAEDARPQPYLVRLRYGDPYGWRSYSWYVKVDDPLSLRVPVKFATQASEFPRFIEAGVDSLDVPVRLDSSTGTPPFSLSVSAQPPAAGLRLKAGRVAWAPRPSDAGAYLLRVVVTDSLRFADTLAPEVTVVAGNRPCTLGVTCRHAVGADGVIDFAADPTLDTLRFGIVDPDPDGFERFTVTIRQENVVSTVEVGDRRTFEVVIDPARARLTVDTVIVVVADRAMHRDTVRRIVRIGAAAIRRVYLNTSQLRGGAGTTDDEYGFPLLVRLKQGQVDLARMAGDGRNLRFRSAGGKLLPYCVEDLDAAGGTLSAWVLWDTVYANRDSQYVDMLLDDAPGAGSSSAVFDAANAYAAVWHLGSARPMADASPAGLTLTDRGTVDAPGVVGRGRSFDGVSASLNPGANLTVLSSAEAFTLSCWARVRSRSSGYMDLIAISINSPNPDEISSRGSMVLEPSLAPAFKVCAPDGYGHYGVSQRSVTVGAWVHLVMTVDIAGDFAAIYQDGEPMDWAAGASAFRFAAGATDATPSSISSIGSSDDAARAFFGGEIDEVMISRARRSAAWARLSYQTQKPGATAVWVR